MLGKLKFIVGLCFKKFSTFVYVSQCFHFTKIANAFVVGNDRKLLHACKRNLNCVLNSNLQQNLNCALHSNSNQDLMFRCSLRKGSGHEFLSSSACFPGNLHKVASWNCGRTILIINVVTSGD